MFCPNSCNPERLKGYICKFRESKGNVRRNRRWVFKIIKRKKFTSYLVKS